MERVHWPHYECQIKKIGDELFVFDPIRRKNVRLFPEEWVRQQFIQHLIQACGYPAGLIQTEQGTKYGNLGKRTDILVYDRQLRPYFLVECKAPYVAIEQETLEQVCQYNHVIQAAFVAVCNGAQYQAYAYSPEMTTYQPHAGIPHYPS
ncbi:MAG: type I restriction enzyme HsdR N-terminal domain-containing protein [Microscillaceae bacterium]